MQCHGKQEYAGRHFLSKRHPADGKVSHGGKEHKVEQSSHIEKPQASKTHDPRRGDAQGLGHIGQGGCPHRRLVGNRWPLPIGAFKPPLPYGPVGPLCQFLSKNHCPVHRNTAAFTALFIAVTASVVFHHII